MTAGAAFVVAVVAVPLLLLPHTKKEAATRQEHTIQEQITPHSPLIRNELERGKKQQQQQYEQSQTRRKQNFIKIVENYLFT